MQAQSSSYSLVNLIEMAQACRQAGDYCQALSLLEQAVRVEPMMVDIGLNLATAYEELGRSNDALGLLIKMAAMHPDCPEINFAIGNLHAQMGDHSEAVIYFREVISAAEDCGEAHYNLGNALRELNRLEEALASFARAAELRPDLAAAHYNLAQILTLFHRTEDAGLQYAAVIALEPGFQNAREHLREISTEMTGVSADIPIVNPPKAAVSLYEKALKLQEQEDWSAAEHCYRAALMLFPDFSEAHNNLGTTLLALGDQESAIACFQKALELRADYGLAHNNLGSVYQKLERFEEALRSYRTATLFSPDSADAWLNLGAMQQQFGHVFEAETSYLCALKLAPNDEQAHDNLGSVLQRQERWGEAENHHRTAVSIDPDSGAAWKNLGIALQAQGKIAEANSCHLEASKLLPKDLTIDYNLWNTWLLLGDFEKGWAKYELWMRASKYNYREFWQPKWAGESDMEGTLLLYADHGFGDAIHFARYAAMAKQRFGGKVVLACQPELLELFQTLEGVDEVVSFQPDDSPLDILYTCQCGLMSLPSIFCTSKESIPAEIPYLKTDSQRVQGWTKKLPQDGKLRVGLRWAGHPAHGNDKNRSCRLEDLLPILRIPNVYFFSLQKEKASLDIQALPFDVSVVDLSSGLTSFAETAAIIQNLDLIISVDTSVAHLAASLGKRVWTMLPFVPDWRWMLKRRDTPWYPNIRLFRQEQAKEWRPVVENISDELQRIVNENRKLLEFT